VKRHRRKLTAAAVAVGTVLAPVTASAASTAWIAPLALSGRTPLPAPTSPQWCGSDATDQSWEWNPTVAVDPTNPGNLVVAWVQDWEDAIVTAYSHDGGAHWSKSFPPTTPCTGGPTAFGTGPTVVSSIDPVVTYGRTADGTHSVIYLGWDLWALGNGHSATMVNRSFDGGKTWSQPVLVDRADIPNCGLPVCPFDVIDGLQITADQTRPGTAYVTWGRAQVPSFAVWNQHVSTTKDSGASWTQPTTITSPEPQTLGDLHVLPNGTAVALLESVPPQTLTAFAAPLPGIAASEAVSESSGCRACCTATAHRARNARGLAIR
jgi:hypothetical protein